MIQCKDSLEFLKEIEDLDLNIIYADPPYALGSEVIIRKDGKVDYARASDFMSKWTVPTGEYWEQWFNEAFRALKHGGYCIMFGMDRQLLLFKYYAHLAGFEEHQSLYWYFISNFPKATDLSKLLDRKLGEVREKVKVDGNKTNNALHITSGEQEVDEPISDLAEKYHGYKHSVAPLKQTNETIMVFKKPSKHGSMVDNVLDLENGDTSINVSSVNIKGSKVKVFGQASLPGRYPSQTFVNDETADVLDKQSGIDQKVGKTYDYSGEKEYSEEGFIGTIKPESPSNYGDPGGCSRILHKCNYEEEDYDIYFYEPKVSKKERDAGLENFESKQYSHDGRETPVNNAFQRNENLAKNHHPTLKPISLNERVLKLFKVPHPQKICYPFAGSGSEVIGGIKAGFDTWVACEINQEYVDIANARIDYWKNVTAVQTTIFDFLE